MIVQITGTKQQQQQQKTAKLKESSATSTGLQRVLEDVVVLFCLSI